MTVSAGRASIEVAISQRPLTTVLFDVDGVLVDAPHERAWRDALEGFAEPQRLTTQIYQARIAGKPRLMGARAALEQLGVPDAGAQAVLYAEQKQRRFVELVIAGQFAAFPDGLRFIQAVRALGFRIAAVSSSKNANGMMARIHVESGGTLLDLFDANLCGREVARGKPDPTLFLLAAAELGVAPRGCLVVEDAPAGIEAAKAGGMKAVGVARLGDAALLQAAHADLVVTSLDQVAVDALAIGTLSARRSEGAM
ncbi:MAG TPA: HAD family hydrolase [Acetobacteraceae bacterium]|jgi:beta-phosphoglucomutase|nr:HAD family hydrolase [Acetobacteraceae bacterium]